MFTIIGADGNEYGPVTADQIKQWMAENRLTADMKARRSGETEWRPIRDFPELASPSPTSPDPAGATPVTASPLAQPSGEREAFVFTGEWTEYFKIWIVNVLLTIVTLGIYAAWAKVRKRRYFYANTKLFGHTFEYLADSGEDSLREPDCRRALPRVRPAREHFPAAAVAVHAVVRCRRAMADRPRARVQCPQPRRGAGCASLYRPVR
jgi:hypothetical protein